MGGGGSPFASMGGGIPGMSSGRGAKRGASASAMPGGFGMGGGGDPFAGMGMGMGMDQDHQEAPQIKDVEKQLPCSLEDLFTGTTKKLKVGARTLSGGTEEKVLSIDVKPGWKKVSNA